MIKILVKKQLMEVFRGYFYNAKKNTARSKLSIIGWFLFFAVIMIGILGGLFLNLAKALCPGLVYAGMDWLYFAIIGMISILLGVFGSVFSTFSGLYLAKDNDLLLSMPIPVKDIVMARLIDVYLMGLMYSAVAIIPAVVVYWLNVPISGAAIIGGIMIVFIISLMVMIFACALGWVTAQLSKKLKNKGVVTALITLICIAAYYFIYFKAQNLIQDIINNAAAYGTMVKGKAYILYLFGRIGEGGIIEIIIFTAINIALLLLVWKLISRSFLGIVSSVATSEKKVYKEKDIKPQPLSIALFKKELGRLTSSSTYMMNCGLGTLLLPILGILFVIKGDIFVGRLNEVFGAQTGIPVILLFAAICLASTMNDMAAPSISLEGKNIWILKSMPINTMEILKAKVMLQVVLSEIPVLFFIICTVFSMKYSVSEFIIIVISTFLFVLCSALGGLTLGLKMPNLTWSNEMIPVKQSATVMIAIFGGWALSAVFVILFFLAGYYIGVIPYLIFVSITELVISLLLISWMKKRGTVLFEEL